MMTSVTGQFALPVTEYLFRREKIKMKYEKPNMEIMVFEMNDIVTLSSEQTGDGNGVTGGWNS